jgi:hypothetical protein
MSSSGAEPYRQVIGRQGIEEIPRIEQFTSRPRSGRFHASVQDTNGRLDDDPARQLVNTRRAFSSSCCASSANGSGP